MSADDGMDGIDSLAAEVERLRAKLKQAEHSNRVLTDALAKARAELADTWTVWDRYAAAALTGIVSRGPTSHPDMWEIASALAGAMLAERSKRASAE